MRLEGTVSVLEQVSAVLCSGHKCIFYMCASMPDVKGDAPVMQ